MFSLCQNLAHETLALEISEYFTLWISLFRIIRNEMQSGIKINSTVVTPRMTHSLAHGDGRGSNKRMRSLGNQDLDTGGVDVDMLAVQKSAKHCGCPHPVRSADPARPQLLCRVRGCGNVQNCREFPQNRFCRRPVPPARAGVQSSFATRRGGIEPFYM